MPKFPAHPDRRPAVITGASSGIGEAIARALAAAGHPVVLGARRVEKCEGIAGEIAASGGEAYARLLDVTDPGSVKDFVAGAIEIVGSIEVVVCNAGEPTLSKGAEVHPDDFASQIDVNLSGAQRIVNGLAPAMIERKRGDIVFISTDAVPTPYPGMAAYVAAKSGLEGLARVMQRELEGTGVRASIVRPGPTLTEMGWKWDQTEAAELVTGFKKWGLLHHSGLLRPEQVARVVVDVVSMPRGSHVTVVEVQPEAPTEGDS
jgi:NADP-dependent 3-hydroxy acid dehydrogenase YdfG